MNTIKPHSNTRNTATLRPTTRALAAAKKSMAAAVKKSASAVLATTILLAGFGVASDLGGFGTTPVYGATATVSAPIATGKVNSPEGVNVRKGPSTSTRKVMGLRDNVSIKIRREVFTTKARYGKKYKWYYISYNGKYGYLRADLVDNIKYTKKISRTTDGVNYRRGAGTGMPNVGTINNNTTIYVVLAASNKVSGDKWYKILKNGSYYYVSAKYVKLGSGATKPAPPKPVEENYKPVVETPTSDVARALRNQKVTDGGEARIVYHFTESNCKQKFGVQGYNNIYTPQGMAYAGDKYYILFATDDGQRIVTYSNQGERLDAVNFNKNRGHLNGMTWNPKTGKCYIFKGNQTTIYTWNPETGAFGTLTTPYSSSGVGYDRIKGKIFCSSLTGIRIYSADDKFEHEKLFNRCTHSGTTYVQDCAAHYGVIFHGVSGSNKATTNYIDFYRSSGAYLGTVQVDIGEIESMAVNGNGYLELLINKAGHTDYIWKTPLKIKELA